MLERGISSQVEILIVRNLRSLNFSEGSKITSEFPIYFRSNNLKKPKFCQIKEVIRKIEKIINSNEIKFRIYIFQY